VTGPDHYRTAEQLAKRAEGLIEHGDSRAPAWAVLAAAATALATSRTEEQEWAEVAATRFSAGGSQSASVARPSPRRIATSLVMSSVLPFSSTRWCSCCSDWGPIPLPGLTVKEAPMDGPQHYREAERILTGMTFTEGGQAKELALPEAVSVAQVHAILALAAATALGSSRDWNDAAGAKLSGDF
jgi:hypothetical protein